MATVKSFIEELQELKAYLTDTSAITDTSAMLGGSPGETDEIIPDSAIKDGINLDPILTRYPTCYNGFKLVQETNTYKNIVLPANSSLIFTYDRDLNRSFGNTGGYIIGKDGLKYILPGSAASGYIPLGTKPFMRQADQFLMKNFDKDSKVIFIVWIGAKHYYSQRDKFLSAVVWAHEIFVHLILHVIWLAALRNDGALTYKQTFLSDFILYKDHFLVNYGYNQLLIDTINEIGTKLLAKDPKQAEQLKMRFITTGIEPYNLDSIEYLKKYPEETRDKRNPADYLNF